MGWRPFALIALALTGALAPQAGAHCQIPCGIFDDETRFSALKEHVATIEKSMKQITELSAATPPNYNQIVRWVNDKDQHADELSEIVTYYFMAQRIKAPADPADQAATAQYARRLTLLHGILVQAMKAKQTVESEYCIQMYRLIDEFHEAYGH